MNLATRDQEIGHALDAKISITPSEIAATNVVFHCKSIPTTPPTLPQTQSIGIKFNFRPKTPSTSPRANSTTLIRM